jgi:nucleoside-diphosphate-sugar epimerase
MRIFITGGTGFVGSHVVNHALAMGHEVLCLRRSRKSNPRIPLIIEPAWLDCAMPEINANDLLGVDIMLHLAAHTAQPPYDRLENCILYNLIHPLALLEKALIAGVDKFVVAGSCFEYGSSAERYSFVPPNAALEPTQTYPASKAAASIAFMQWALQNKVSLSIQRIFHVYGEGEDPSRFYPSLIAAAKNDEDFPMSEGQQVRDFVPVESVARALIMESERIASDTTASVTVSNLGSGNPQSVLQFAENIWSTHGAKGKLLLGALPYREGEVMRYVPEVGSRHVLSHI